MNLGQRIYELRKAKNLSQGELADRLDVSRQSISKWENDSSVPELDKLIKMSDIFGVSMDTLIKGSDEDRTAEAPRSMAQSTDATTVSQTQRIIGAILLALGVLAFLLFSVIGGIFSGLIFSSPFIFCGIICLIFKRRAGLWCAWSVYFLVDVYLACATNISRGHILMTFMWTSEMNYLILIFSWISVTCLAALILSTLISYKNYCFVPKRKSIAEIAIFIAITVIFGAACLVFGNRLSESLVGKEYKAWETQMNLFRVLSFINSWLKITSFTLTLNCAIGYIRTKRSQSNSENKTI